MMKLAVSLLTALFISVSSFSLAESANTAQSSVDLSGLSGEDQGQANVVACLIDCFRESTLDARYERSRYDVYYETETGFVLSDPTDPDSELVGCSEISCEPPPRAATVRSICFARYDRLNDFANCALKCESIGRIYSDSLFDDEPFSSYLQSSTNHAVRLCGRVNNRPFTDYDSTCPEIAFVDGEAIDCSRYDDESDMEANITARSRGINLVEPITGIDRNSLRAPPK